MVVFGGWLQARGLQLVEQAWQRKRADGDGRRQDPQIGVLSRHGEEGRVGAADVAQRAAGADCAVGAGEIIDKEGDGLRNLAHDVLFQPCVQ